jgi:hypothetical protein
MAMIGQNIVWADFVAAVKDRCMLLFARNGTPVNLKDLQGSLRRERNIFAELEEITSALVELLKDPTFSDKFKLVYKNKEDDKGSNFHLVYDAGHP